MRLSPSARAVVLLGFGFVAAPAAHAACGDGVQDADEACDDGARDPGDGCDDRCQVEPGWVCTDADLRRAFDEVLLDESNVRGGFHRPPRWITTSTADRVLQEENAKAAIYGTALPMSEVQLTLDVRVGDDGDDFVGLSVGYEPGDRASAGADWILLDWKRADYRSSGCRGAAGLSLSQVRGPLQDVDELWCHTGAVHELARANTLGAQGWEAGRTYRVRLEYTRNRVRVYVDGALEISVDGLFPEGELGLYAFSQEDIVWSLIEPKDRSVCAGLDRDGDGLADAVERRLGLDPERPDTDLDGVPDREELGDPTAPLDSDLDGKINALDPDDDGDGARTADETWDGDRDPRNDDTDRDGLPDFLDGDDDGDGVPSSQERVGKRDPTKHDTDDDGRPDMVDVDDDGDGLLTIIELGLDISRPPDHDGDGVPDYLDADDDGDGIPTVGETYDGDRAPGNDDTDHDGIPDYLDTDDDGDGIPTQVETADSAGARDVDFDGRPDHVDRVIELPEGVSAPGPEVEEAPAAEPPPEPASAVEQLSAALGEGLGLVPEGGGPKSATPEGWSCGCASGGPVPVLTGWLAALGALAARRARGGVA